jgi:hypothetical protein
MQAEQKEQYFSQAKAILGQIVERGAQSYFEASPQTKHCFRIEKRVINCMDEGTPGGFRVAGSLILLPEKEAQFFVRESSAEGLFSHTDCGAAALAFRRKYNLKANEKVALKEIDEFAKAEAKRIAKITNIAYWGHLEKNDLQRPLGLHIASAAYYLGIPYFDPSKNPILPPGFVISRKFLPKDYAQFELQLAINIALGEHGFDGLFSQNEPFLLIIITERDSQEFTEEKLKEEVIEVINSLSPEFSSLIKVESFLLD